MNRTVRARWHSTARGDAEADGGGLGREWLRYERGYGSGSWSGSG
ncbi:hypothetical protein [Caudoviricetes sp.]|nr:hypothetical protein [Caudoviricetes sp.]